MTSSNAQSAAGRTAAGRSTTGNFNWSTAVTLLAVVAGLAACYHDAVATYLRDNYYQSHFLFLWVFFAAAMYRAGRGNLRTMVGLRSAREVGGCLCVLVAAGLLHVGLITGSSTTKRLSLVAFFAAVGLLAMPKFTARRALAYSGFALLCFGVPYSAYFQLTKLSRTVLVAMVERLPDWTPLAFELRGATIHFADGYSMAITADCSGFNQLVTFLGIAYLGSLTGRPSLWRTGLLFATAVGMAFGANLDRVLTFIVLVQNGYRQVIEDPTWHEVTGFLAYAPFILGFVWLVLKTHRPLPAATEHMPVATTGPRLPLPLLLVPLLAIRGLHGIPETIDPTPPQSMQGIESPPGYDLVQRAPSEAREREVYDTQWLVNGVYRSTEEPQRYLELFSYVTRSRAHLAIHQVSNCLDVPGQHVRYGPRIEVDGRSWWTLEIDGVDGPRHGYFAFQVDGEHFDDKWGTQLEVFRRRLTGGVREVGLTRMLFSGPLVEPTPEHELRLLRWRGQDAQPARPGH